MSELALLWNWSPMIATVICGSCGGPFRAGHYCPTALPYRDLSPLGGGPKP